MKKVIQLFSVCFFVVLSTQAYAQIPTFIKSYGNSGYDFGRDIKQTLDTGYIATGSSSSFATATADAFLMKVDSLGNFKWSYNYGGSGADWGEKVVLTSDSAFALAGYTNSYGTGGFDFFVVKTDINGVPEWQKTYGGSDWDRAYSLVQLPDSGFVVVGETFSYGAGDADMYIVRLDKNGDEVWTQTYGGEALDFASDCYLLGDTIIVVGGTESFGSGMLDGIMLNCFVGDGTIGDVKVIGQEGEDFFNTITQQKDYFAIGGSRSYNYAEGCDCGLDFWVHKADTVNFATIVDTTWGGTQFGEDRVYDIVLNENDDIFYGGSTTSWGSIDIAEGKTDAFLGKLLNTYFTAFDYVKNFGEQGDDAVYGLDYCFDGGIVGIGESRFKSTGGTNMIIFRIDQVNAYPFDIAMMETEIITVSVPEIDLGDDFQLYPTLFQEEITIAGVNELFNVQLMDMNGRIVFQQQNNQFNTKLGLGMLANGIYLLQISTEKGQYTQRVVKN